MSDYADQARRVAEGIRAVTRFDEALALLLLFEERVRAEERDLAAMIAQGVTHDPQCGNYDGFRCCRCRAEAAEAELAAVRRELFEALRGRTESTWPVLGRAMALAPERDKAQQRVEALEKALRGLLMGLPDFPHPDTPEEAAVSFRSARLAVRDIRRGWAALELGVGPADSEARK